jgi:hypothetical protein
MAKVFTITVPPDLGRKKRERTTDPRYVDGQRLLVEAMKYLAQSDPVTNRGAIEFFGTCSHPVSNERLSSQLDVFHISFCIDARLIPFIFGKLYRFSVEFNGIW